MPDSAADDELPPLPRVLLNLRRDLLLTQATLKALEAAVVGSLPAEARAAWYDRYEALRREYHQRALEAVEDMSPELGARLDDRPPGEVP